jgi:hypothetical protein
MNYPRSSWRLIQLGIAFLALGVIGYDALLWLPLGLDNAQSLMKLLLGLSALGAICIAGGAAMKAAVSPVRLCISWGSWLIAGSILCAMALPLNAFFVPLLAALLSGLLLLLIGGLRMAPWRAH